MIGLDVIFEYPEVWLARSKINSETDNRTGLRCSSDRDGNGYRCFALFGCLLSLTIAIAIARSGVDWPQVAVVVTGAHKLFRLVSAIAIGKR